MYVDFRVEEMGASGIMFHIEPKGPSDTTAIVFQSPSDFEAAARSIWADGYTIGIKGLGSEFNFNDVWPELKRKLLGE
jgi:hypothetical protein